MSNQYHVVLKDDFAATADNSYPDGWLCEQNSEKPFKLGAVIGGEFYLMFMGNKHIPVTPPLKDFSLEFNVRGDRYYGAMGIEIFFRYDTDTREGWLLRYDWGIAGNKTNAQQREIPEYTCALFRYYGGRCFSKYQSVASVKAAGFIKDLSIKQPIRLLVRNNKAQFQHGEMSFPEMEIPGGFPENGFLAFDRSHAGLIQGAPRISALLVASDIEIREKTLRPETATEFPSGPNAIISPYCFHVMMVERNGVPTLRMKLTGGPSKEPVYPDIDRSRFNEKMMKPYVRLEGPLGQALGTFRLANGSVGLGDYHWNIKASAMSPADCECPLSREVALEALPGDVKVFIGCESYMAEDSLGNAGGPTEALIDYAGKVLYVGPRFAPGDVHFTVASPPDKQICARIPKDIPHYADALIFAQRNHFFVEGEKVRFEVAVNSRDDSITLPGIKAFVGIEDVFGETVFPEFAAAFTMSDDLAILPGARRFSTGFITLPGMNVGVYHIRVRISGAALPGQRHAFEIMPVDPQAIPAPLASGLPKLYPNILSGICNEHFHPWSHAVVDTAHYNSGGNNYFKVARKWRAPELLHVYGRKWICWLKSYATVFDERGIEPNKDLVAEADAVPNNMTRGDLRYVECYRVEFVFNALLEFLRSGDFVPSGRGELNFEAVAANGRGQGLSRGQFQELVEGNWKQWLRFFAVKNLAVIREKAEAIWRINPDCRPFFGVYPTYSSKYKSGGYFPFLFGYDLRQGIGKYLPGPSLFEDYPYSSGYPISRGIYSLASCKLEDPKRVLYPEVFGVNGETLDPRVVFANPPLGQSDPPPGFLIKQFYEYSFAAAWFDRNGFNFWDDHGYYPKTWDRENYAEMLYAYAFISRLKPAKPLRTSAFVFSRDACFAHPDHYDSDEDLYVNGSVVNTAEESVAFAYEQARADGQLAGFLVKMEDVSLLNPADVDTLVIPPLCGVNDEQKAAIRKLHERGVALFGFEDVSGLEDLFGVARGAGTKVHNILPGEHPAAAPHRNMTAFVGHALCVSRHCRTTATALLKAEGDVPVLTVNDTQWGRTAFFALPPTFVNRSKTLVPSNGQVCNSDLICAATRLAMRLVGDKEAETSAGALVGFRDSEGAAHLIVEEDRCPEKGQPIRPLVKIKIPGIKAENIVSDKPYEAVAINEREARLRFSLAANESARIKIFP